MSMIFCLNNQSLLTNSLSNDCLASIFCLLSVWELYRLFAVGCSKLVWLLEENVSTLDFSSPFVACRGGVNTEYSSLKASSFWQNFRKVTRIVLSYAPINGFLLPRHMLQTIKDFEVMFGYQIDVLNNRDIVLFNVPTLSANNDSISGSYHPFVLPIKNMPHLRSLSLYPDARLNLASPSVLVLPETLSNSLTHLHFGLDVSINPSTLPRSLRTLEMFGHFNHDHPGDGEYAGIESARHNDFVFPSTLRKLIFTITRYQSDHDLQDVCKALPQTMRELLFFPRCDLPLQVPFDQYLPKDLLYLSVCYDDDKLHQAYSHIDLENLPRGLETLYWTVQPDLSQGLLGSKIIKLPTSLKKLDFKHGGFCAKLWPNVIFTNPDMSVRNVRVDAWPDDEEELARTGLRHSMIGSFFGSEYTCTSNEGRTMHNYFDMHPLPPKLFEVCVNHMDVPFPKHLNPLPARISTLFVEDILIPQFLPSSLTKLRLDMQEARSEHVPAFFKGCRANNSLPPTLLTLIYLNYKTFENLDVIDLAESCCPRLHTLQLESCEEGDFPPIVIKSLPPLLKRLELVRIQTDLWSLCQLFSEHLCFCRLNLKTRLPSKTKLMLPFVQHKVGSLSKSGWTFKFKHVPMKQSDSVSDDIPNILVQRLCENDYLNCVEFDIQSMTLRRLFYKRRDRTERPNLCEVVSTSNINSKKRPKCSLSEDDELLSPLKKKKKALR